MVAEISLNNYYAFMVALGHNNVPNIIIETRSE